MILDINHIRDLTLSFYNLTWILGINHTSSLFYTSDNPIGTKAHVQHPLMSMSGIKSKEVEVYFPLSPNLILIMFDGSYYVDLTSYDRRYISLSEDEDFEEYNWYCVHNSNGCVFSKDGNFSLINEILQKDPRAFDIVKMSLSWGGKKYTPDRN